MRRTDSFEKTLMLGKIEGRGEGDDRRWDGCMALPTQWTWVWASYGRWWRTGKLGVLQSMKSQRAGHDWATEQQHRGVTDSVIATAVVNSLQLCPTIGNPTDCSPQGSSVHGICQARITGVGCHAPPPGDHPYPGIEPASFMSPTWAGGFFTTSAIWEAWLNH